MPPSHLCDGGCFWLISINRMRSDYSTILHVGTAIAANRYDLGAVTHGVD